MEGQAVAVLLEWCMRMVHSYLQEQVQPNYKLINSVGTKKLTFSISNPPEELALVMGLGITITPTKLLLVITFKL